MARQNAGQFNSDGDMNISVNLDTTALADLSKTLKDISKGKDLQNYWGNVESAIERTNNALKKFKRDTDSIDYAENLIKNVNALKALTNQTDLSGMFSDINFDDLLDSAKRIAPQIASQFSVGNFAEAFKTFDLLKAKGIELQDVLQKLTRFKSLENELFSTRQENRQFKNALGDNDVETLKQQLKELSNIREEAENTFRNFLDMNNIDEDSFSFIDYFDRIRNGTLTAKEAIKEFKREYDYLLNSESNNVSAFSIEQLQDFSNKLDQIFIKVEDTSNKIRDIFENGVVAKTIKDFGINNIDETLSPKNINDQQLKEISVILEDIQFSLSSIKTVFVDVGDGEEFSPLLQTIKNVESAINSLSQATKGIGFNMNIDVGSNKELEQQLESKVANALSAYERLFEHIKMSNAGDSYMMNNFFDFDINQFDTMMAKVQAYRTFIENQRKDYEARTGHSGAYDKTDKKYWTQASSAMGQITKIQNEIKASNDGSSLENLFGKTDLTEVISGLNQIVVKLDEIVNSAKDLKTAFADGLKIEAATADVTELTNRVKALEEELSKLKSVKSPTSQNTSSSQKNQNPTKGNSQAYNEQIAIIQKLVKARTELNNAERRNKNSSRDKEIADLKTQIAELEPKAKEAEQAIEKMYNPTDGSHATITAEQYASALEKIKESATGSAKSVNDLVAAQKAALQSQISGYESDVSRWDKIVHDRETKPETDSQSSTYQNNLTVMKAAYHEMHDLQVKMSEAAKQGIGPSKEDVKRFGELKTKLEGCEQSFKDLTAAQKGSTSLSRDKLFNKIGDYLHKNSGMAKEFKVQLEALQKELTLRGADANVSDLTDKFLKLQIAIREAGQEGRTFLDVVKDKAWYGLAGQIATYFSFQDIVRYIGQGIQVVRELDTARTEMMKVSDESEKSLRNYQKATFDVADAVGTTAKQIQNSTADYMRLGEALDDAAESARVANVLLNVSEFDNIEDATKSLVSMGQAYKDLDKMSIVDKLNEVGNNYSISTDELASALQRSAATLSLMGNTIDEAAALVTTANSVIQDADSVSAGLRTISLRLVGTEEAEEELSAMNEEIDAFVAATNSKKQQIIKDYTAVASNNYKGFDILDDNGNYKNTYEILLGIAKVYKEIQEQDKKLGTNHAVALVEELAGKNRSNIASAILQDPKQLEAVRKSSEEAFGSAEEELGKYLDSIDGRLAQMTNRIQEFWSTTINDNAIKNIISFATTAIELFTKLSDTFGLVNVGALGLGAVLSTQNVGRGKMYPLMFEYADNNMCSLGY